MPKRSFDDPLYNGTPYSMDDVDAIEEARGKPYPRLRKTVELLERLRREISERDHKRRDGYAQAALTGIIAREGTYAPSDMREDALEIADAFMEHFSEEPIDDPEEDEIEDPEDPEDEEMPPGS